MDFEIHQVGCAKCLTVNVNQSATLVNCCAEGASMLRDYIAKLKAPEVKKEQKALKRQFLMQEDGNVYKSTKAKVKLVTRYK
jgi:hypothetical protein